MNVIEILKNAITEIEKITYDAMFSKNEDEKQLAISIRREILQAKQQLYIYLENANFRKL